MQFVVALSPGRTAQRLPTSTPAQVCKDSQGREKHTVRALKNVKAAQNENGRRQNTSTSLVCRPRVYTGRASVFALGLFGYWRWLLQETTPPHGFVVFPHLLKHVRRIGYCGL